MTVIIIIDIQLFDVIFLRTPIVGAGLSGEDGRRVAVVEGDPVTLECGTDLTGNPLPLLVWRDNNAMSVFGMEGERNGLLLIVTVIALPLSELCVMRR